MILLLERIGVTGLSSYPAGLKSGCVEAVMGRQGFDPLTVAQP